MHRDSFRKPREEAGHPDLVGGLPPPQHVANHYVAERARLYVGPLDRRLEHRDQEVHCGAVLQAAAARLVGRWLVKAARKSCATM